MKTADALIEEVKARLSIGRSPVIPLKPGELFERMTIEVVMLSRDAYDEESHDMVLQFYPGIRIFIKTIHGAEFIGESETVQEAIKCIMRTFDSYSFNMGD